MNAPLPAGLMLGTSTALVVRPDISGSVLGPALLEATQFTVPLSASSIEAWWDAAQHADRLGLVLRIARALPTLQGLAAARLHDPGWRYNAGLPLALAIFAYNLRMKKRHRAENTVRAWRSDWRTWRSWCKHAGRPSFNPSAGQLSEFFADYAPTHKVATIRRLGATLTAMHKAAGFPDPLSQPLNVEVWLDALKPPLAKARKAARSKATTAKRAINSDRRDIPVDQAEGLRRETLDQVLEMIDTDTLIGARDAALLTTLYDLLGRRAEVVALTLEDVASDENDPSGTVLIRRSKTDQAGEGRTLYLRPDTYARILHWIKLAGVTSGPIFRALKGFAGRGRQAIDLPTLESPEVARIVRRRVAEVLKNPDGTPADAVKLFSGHSCRVGAAQDMAENGATDIEIMLAGRWTSLTMVARYTAKIRAKQGGMARLAAKQDAQALLLRRGHADTQVRSSNTLLESAEEADR